MNSEDKYQRLLSIREVRDENIEEYHKLFKELYENKDDTTFSKFCTVILDESPYYNTSEIDSAFRNYIEGYFFDGEINEALIYKSTKSLLLNMHLFIPQAKETLKSGLAQELNLHYQNGTLLFFKKILSGISTNNHQLFKTLILELQNEKKEERYGYNTESFPWMETVIQWW